MTSGISEREYKMLEEEWLRLAEETGAQNMISEREFKMLEEEWIRLAEETGAQQVSSQLAQPDADGGIEGYEAGTGTQEPENTTVIVYQCQVENSEVVVTPRVAHSQTIVLYIVPIVLHF